LKFIEARDDRFLKRQPGAKTESARIRTFDGSRLDQFPGKKALLWLRQIAHCSPDRPTIWVRFLPKA
jgi:hypothetical protein